MMNKRVLELGEPLVIESHELLGAPAVELASECEAREFLEDRKKLFELAQVHHVSGAVVEAFDLSSFAVHVEDETARPFLVETGRCELALFERVYEWVRDERLRRCYFVAFSVAQTIGKTVFFGLNSYQDGNY